MPHLCTVFPCLYPCASTLFNKPNDYVYDSPTPNTTAMTDYNVLYAAAGAGASALAPSSAATGACAGVSAAGA